MNYDLKHKNYISLMHKNHFKWIIILNIQIILN